MTLSSPPTNSAFSTVLTIGALLWGASIALVGTTLLGIVLALQMESRGYDTTVTSVVMAGNFAGFLVGALYATRLINQVGHIRAFAIFATLQSALFLTHPILDHWAVWAVLRLLSGACLAGIFTAVESWMNDRTPAESRGTVLAIYVITSYIAQIGGQLLVNVWDFTRFEPFIVASILGSLSLIPVAMTRLDAPELSDVQRMGLMELVKASPTAIAGTLGSGVLVGSTQALGAVFGQRLGLSVYETSLFTGSIFVGGMLLTFPVGRLADALDRRLVLIGLLAVAMAISVLLLTSASHLPSIWFLLGLMVVFGGAQASVYPIAIAQAFDYIAPQKYISAASGLLIVFSVGATIGPILASFAMRWRAEGLFLTTAVLSAGMLTFIAYRMTVRDAVPEELQESVTIVPTTPGSIEMMDLADEAADFEDHLDEKLESFDDD